MNIGNKQIGYPGLILKKSFLVVLILTLVLILCANSIANGAASQKSIVTQEKPVSMDKPARNDDSQINIAIGETYTLKVTGGAPPFSLKDYDPKLVDITPLDIHTYLIAAKALGSTRLTINDKKGVLLSTKNITVINKADKMVVVFDKSDIYPGDIITLSISGGTPPYKLFVINAKIAELLPNQTNTFKFAAKNPGKTQLAISDSSGQVKVQDISVLEKPKPVLPITIKVLSEINTGESTTLSIEGGAPPYSVNVLNNKIVDLVQTGLNSFQITGKTPGTTQLTVTDSKSQTARQAISVIQEFQTLPLSISMTPDQIRVGESAKLKIDGGVPPYGVNVLNSKIVDITQTGANEFQITGKIIGTTPLTVFDAKRQSAQKTIRVFEKPAPITPITVSVLSEIRIGETTGLTISGGVPPYKINLPGSTTVLQNSIIDLTQTGSNSYQIKGKRIGQVQLTIIDANDQSVFQKINVVQRILPLAASLPPEVNIGETVTLSVIGGDPPYNVNPNNKLISVFKADNNTFQIKGIASGKTLLVVFDKRGQRIVKTISVVQKSPTPLAIYNMPQEIYVGDSVTLEVSGGIPPYNMALPNNYIIDYSQIGNNLFQITAKMAGEVQITIFDHNAQKIQRTLSVIEKIQPLSTNLVSEIYVGDQTTLIVDGGTPPYSVTMPNNKLIDVSRTGRNSFQINGKASGKIQLTIFDSKGQSIQQVITVLEKIPPLTINIPSADMKVGDTQIFSVTGGNPPYFVTASNKNIVDVTQSGINSFKISAKDAGKALLKIYDSGMQSEFKTINIEKKPELLNIVLPSTKINIEESEIFKVINGVPPYYMANLNPDIADISQTTDNSFTITGKEAGKAQFVIYDSEGQNVLRTVTVINPLAITFSTEEVQAGNSTTLKVSGGAPPYYVSSPSSEITIAQTGEKQFDISSSYYGDYKITVFDNNGQSTSKTISFYPDLLWTQLISYEIVVGKSTVIVVSGGVPPYKVTSKDRDILKVAPITEDIFLVTGLTPGDTKILVSDSFKWTNEEEITVKLKK